VGSFQELLQLLSFAAVISFMSSPILAYMNYRVMNCSNVPEGQSPEAFLTMLGWAGMLFLLLMGLGFLYVTFIRQDAVGSLVEFTELPTGQQRGPKKKGINLDRRPVAVMQSAPAFLDNLRRSSKMRTTVGRISLIRLAICLLLALSLTLSGCSDGGNNHRITLTVAAIEQNPNTYLDNGDIIGTDVDIASLAAEDAGIDLNFEMMDSAQQAIDLTQAGPKRALLGIAYSAERKDLFQWVGPISKGRYVIFAKKASGVGGNLNLQEAQGLDSIAAVEGWLETTTLEEHGFENLHTYPSYAAAYQAFVNDEVVAIAGDLMQLAVKVRGDYVIGVDIDPCYSYKTPFYYMAFSKDVDSSVIAAMQQSLNQLITEGVTLEVTKNYFPTATRQIIPDVLQLMTEVSPPLSIMTGPINNYSVDGASVDLVDEIQIRNGYQATINLTSWKDGFDTVQYLPNSAYFTTLRTDEREALVQWVGPIVATHPGLYTLASKELHIADLEEAKGLTAISTPHDWPNHIYLLDIGFENVDATSNDSSEAFQQLLDGAVDAMFTDAEAIDWLCQNAGIERADVVLQFAVPAADQEGWIAFSLETPAATVNQWQASLDTMWADGTFTEIWQRWFGDAALLTGELAP
jgi:polar amino acid transport system substrate-binding protein